MQAPQATRLNAQRTDLGFTVRKAVETCVACNSSRRKLHMHARSTVIVCRLCTQRCICTLTDSVGVHCIMRHPLCRKFGQVWSSLVKCGKFGPQGVWSVVPSAQVQVPERISFEGRHDSLCEPHRKQRLVVSPGEAGVHTTHLVLAKQGQDRSFLQDLHSNPYTTYLIQSCARLESE